MKVMCKLQKLLWKGQDDCNAIHRALPQMGQISPFISVMQHQTCFNADVEHFTGDHICCGSSNILVRLPHWGDCDINKQQQKEKNIQKNLNQLLPDYLTLSSIREGQNKKHLLSRTAKSFLGTKHQKLKIFLPNTSSNFRIKHTSPQSRLLHLLPNTSATLCNFVQELLVSTTIRNKEFCLGLKSGVGQSKSQ